MKAKVGDVVHVRGVVTGSTCEGRDYCVSVLDGYAPGMPDVFKVWVKHDSIVHVEPQPQPLKVGDVVKRNGQPFTVISTLNNVAWLRDELGYITADLGDLERVPDEPEVTYKSTERYPDPPTHYTVNWKPLFG